MVPRGMQNYTNLLSPAQQARWRQHKLQKPVEIVLLKRQKLPRKIIIIYTYLYAFKAQDVRSLHGVHPLIWGVSGVVGEHVDIAGKKVNGMSFYGKGEAYPFIENSLTKL